MTDYSYDRIAEEWEAARSSLDRERPCLDLVLEKLSPQSIVLDVGCGTGRPIGEYVIAGGHHLVGVDESKKLLAKARGRFPTAEFIRARMEEFAFDRPCGAAICWDSLFHLDRRHHEPILTVIARCLPSGGRLMFSCGGSASGAFTDVMFGHEFFYDSNSPDETLGIMDRIGFQIVVADLIDKPDGGRNKGRLAIVGEKR